MLIFSLSYFSEQSLHSESLKYKADEHLPSLIEQAHLFHKTHEQTHIAYVSAKAACIGPYRGTCNGGEGKKIKYNLFN